MDNKDPPKRMPDHAPEEFIGLIFIIVLLIAGIIFGLWFLLK